MVLIGQLFKTWAPLIGKIKGGPLVAPPQREGFGTKLIAQSSQVIIEKITPQLLFDGFNFAALFAKLPQMRIAQRRCQSATRR